jgi:L-ascorbate metabolism protein UlaG (beta-lactamase superfamily)
MLDNISVFHSSIKIVGTKIIYFDPYKIEENYHDADIVFITHEHFDHYSKDDIEKIIKETTTLIMPKSMEKNNKFENTIYVEPNTECNIDGTSFKTIRAYNTNKKFHPIENDWLGYLVNLDETNYYVAGDTDITEEAKLVKCDIAMLPCGGTYTMDYKEAAELANIISPKYVVPTHYGSVVGNKVDGRKMIELLNKEITGVELIK